MFKRYVKNHVLHKETLDDNIKIVEVNKGNALSYRSKRSIELGGRRFKNLKS